MVEWEGIVSVGRTGRKGLSVQGWGRVCVCGRAIRVRRCIWRAAQPRGGQGSSSQAVRACVRACVRGRAAAIGGKEQPGRASPPKRVNG